MKIKYILIILTLCLVLLMPNAWGQASSTNYTLTAGNPVGGGGSSSSSGYVINGAVPLSGSGASSSASYGITGGAASILVSATALTADYAGGALMVVPKEDRVVSISYGPVIGNETATFRYRQGGHVNYSSAPMTGGGGSFSYTISESMLTTRGLEYYFIVTQGSQTALIGDANDPYVLIVELTNAQGQRPSAMPDAQYRIIGLPIRPGVGANIENVFTDDLGPPNNTQWRLGRYNPSTDVTDEFPDVPMIEPGIGYWLIARGGKTYGVAGTTVIPNFLHNNIPYYRSTSTLDTGWNQLANPYPFDINWNEILFQDGAAVQVGHPAAVLDDAAWWYSNNGYINVTTILGWDGFFVHINKAGIRILFPYHEAVTAKIVPDKLQSDITSDYWTVNLRLEANGLIDGYNQIGVRPDALPGTDKYDHFEPPPPPGGASLAFKFEEEGLKCTDFRPPFNDGAVWDVHISDCENAALIVSGLNDIPDDMQAWLKVGKGTIIKLSENVPVSLQSGSAKLIIGTEAYLAGENADLLPLRFALEQNYPNPFNPATNLPYSLPAPGQVKLELFNVLGQKVRTLVDDMMPAGKYTVTWDSRDDNGYEVASGIYFYRIEYGDLVKQRKMVLLK